MSVLCIVCHNQVSKEGSNVKTHWSIKPKFWINDLS